MPRSTCKYGFEFKVCHFAFDISRRFGGSKSPAAFLLALDSDDSVLTLSFDPPCDGWSEWKKRMEAAGMAHLFYDPFDAPDHTWLSWHGIAKSTMERLMKSTFEAEDFVHEGCEGRETLDYPQTWGVMF